MRPEFVGYPRTRRYVRKDRSIGRHVLAQHLTPIRAMIADALGGLTAAGLFVGGIYYLSKTGSADIGAWLGVLFGPWVFCPVLQWLWGLLLSKKLSLSYDIKHLKHHRLLPRAPFDAREVRRFSLDQHRLAEWESARIELRQAEAAMKGRIVRPKKYFLNCANLMVDYHHEDVSLGPIYSVYRAKKIAKRMQGIHVKTVNQAVNRSDDTDGDDGWTRTSGEY